MIKFKITSEIRIMDYNNVIQALVSLTKRYSLIKRYSNTLEREKSFHALSITDREFNSDDVKKLIMRESLIEHVGHLPILATYLHPIIQEESDLNIDLGKVLIMLAYHDIGELELGDELEFSKSKEKQEAEVIAGLKMIHPLHREYYSEFFDGQSIEAKFALSIDKIAPSIQELTIPQSIPLRSEVLGYDINDLKDRQKYYEWNKFLSGLYTEVISQMEEIIDKP